ncbi:MAG: ABC transporter permease subunit [Eubacteriales bacterium]
MNMFIHELKVYRKSTVVWMISLASIVIFFMSMFPVIFKDAQLMQEILGNFPPEFLTAFGISALDLSSELGFYGFLFTYILLAGSIQAMNLGTSVLSAEVRDNTAEFLLAKPVNRVQIVTSKVSAIFIHLILTDVVYIIAAKVMLDIVKENTYDGTIFFIISITLLFLQVFFMSFGLLVSVLMKKIRTVMPISLGSVFGFYVIHLLNETLNDEKLTYITPFEYFKPQEIIESGNLDWKYIMLIVILTGIFIASSYIIYKRKDIPSI